MPWWQLCQISSCRHWHVQGDQSRTEGVNKQKTEVLRNILGLGCFTDLKCLVLVICELGSLPGECPGWTCLDPDLYFQGILHNPSSAKHSPRLGQYGDFLCNFSCRRHLEQCPISEKSLNQRVQRKTCTSRITIFSSPEVEFLLNLSVINRVAWSVKGCVKQETNRQSKGKEWKPKLSEMTHESTGSRYGTVWKREKWKKKRKRKKQRKTREEKGAEEVSGNLAAGADICPGLNRYYILKEYGGAASIASVRAGKR